MMTQDQALEWLRTELPKMLQDDPTFRVQVIGTLTEVFATKGEVAQILDELRAMRAESERRFEAANARFQAMLDEMRTLRAESERRFEAVERRLDRADEQFVEVRSDITELKSDVTELKSDVTELKSDVTELKSDVTELKGGVARLESGFAGLKGEVAGVKGEVAKVALSIGALGGRMSRKLEDVIRQVIENFSGVGPLKAERLGLIDQAGEFRHPGATVEFDALVTNGRKFLVEVKSFAKTDDVWTFSQKARFAEAQLGETFEKVLIAPAATPSALELANQLGILCHVFSVEE
jgi:hypothetical protein